MKTNVKNIFFLFTLVAMTFSACTKDNPVPEENQEEYDSAEVTFTNTEDQHDVVVIKFDKEGHPTPHHIHLTVGDTYTMNISMFYKGKNINNEIEEAADEHQFFFLGAPADVLEYTYGETTRIGLSGTLKVLKPSASSFEWNIVLRHGLDKASSAAQAWNSPDYRNAGGSDDLNIAFEIHPSTSGDHDHDH